MPISPYTFEASSLSTRFNSNIYNPYITKNATYNRWPVFNWQTQWVQKPQQLTWNKNPSLVSPQQVMGPPQTLGLIPMFDCCVNSDAVGSFTYVDNQYTPSTTEGFSHNPYVDNIPNVDLGCLLGCPAHYPPNTTSNFQWFILGMADWAGSTSSTLTNLEYSIMNNSTAYSNINVWQTLCYDYFIKGNTPTMNTLTGFGMSWSSNSNPSYMGYTVSLPSNIPQSEYGSYQIIFLEKRGSNVFGWSTPAPFIGVTVAGSGVSLSTIDLNIGGNDLGTFSSSYTYSNTIIATEVNNLLTHTPFSATVSGDYTNRVVMILSPTGSGLLYNDVTLSASSSYSTIQSYPLLSSVVSDCLCDPREGLYMADTIADDRNFVLPVFGTTYSYNEEQISTFRGQKCDLPDYETDYSTFMFSYPFSDGYQYDPITSGEFQLQKLIGSTWSTITTLDYTNSYGTAFSSLIYGCQTVAYYGYTIQWGLVLNTFGEGTYRFHLMDMYNIPFTYCQTSTPLCLKAWNVQLASGTVKFETQYSGGNYGSVTQQGINTSLCCSDVNGNSLPININDSIRFPGFFGYETVEYERDFVKYATGVINKVRDEAVKNFVLKTDKLPMWFHQRFYAYALMADELYVSDYNLNNANYNYKKFWVVADGNYTPTYTNNSRYIKIQELKFKEGIQNTWRDRCCTTYSSSLFF